MRKPDTGRSAAPTLPLGLLIKGMLGAGALYAAFILLGAAQKPDIGVVTIEEAAAKVPGFRLSGGSDLPPALADVLSAPLPDAVALYLWPPGCESPCAAEFAALSETVTGTFTPVAIRQLNARAGERWQESLPESATGIVDRQGLTTALLGGSARGVVYFCRGAQEIGHAAGVEWRDAHTRTLINRL